MTEKEKKEKLLSILKEGWVTVFSLEKLLDMKQFEIEKIITKNAKKEKIEIAVIERNFRNSLILYRIEKLFFE